jgi:hypothetical protein
MAAVEMLEGSDAPSAQFHWNFVKNEEEWLALPGEEEEEEEKAQGVSRLFCGGCSCSCPRSCCPCKLK